MSLPEIIMGRDRKQYSRFVYNELWQAFNTDKKRHKYPSLAGVRELLFSPANDKSYLKKLQQGGLDKVRDIIRALKHLGIQYRKNDGRLIKQRQRQQEHTRIINGKKVKVNQGLKKNVKAHRFPVIPPKPMLAKKYTKGVELKNWLTERKFDGFRIVAIIRANNRVKLFSRDGVDYTNNFPDVANNLSHIAKTNKITNAMFDGEMVYLDEKGNDHFKQIQRRLQIKDKQKMKDYLKRFPAKYFIFDVMEYNEKGETIKNWPLISRKALLQKVIPKSYKHLALTQYTQCPEGRKKLLATQLEKGREGVMHKQPQSPYIENYRAPFWLKHKFSKTEDVIIIGYSPGKGDREGMLGALYTAMFDKDGKLVYTGKVGTGFTENDLTKVQYSLDALPKIDEPLKTIKGIKPKLNMPEINAATWVQPHFVAEIEYFELSQDNRFRHGVYLRKRLDKKPKECKLKNAKEGNRNEET